jgi:hypothetical protein
MTATRNRQVKLAKIAVVFLGLSIGIIFFLSAPHLWFLIILPAIVLGLIWLSVRDEPRFDGPYVTPQQLADELERSLFDTENQPDWDSVYSLQIRDRRLDQLRSSLMKFDSSALNGREDELRDVIAALRRGEIPNIRE